MLKLNSLFKSVISLTLIFVSNLFKNKDKKIIMFYFPIKIYQDNLLNLVDKLKSNNKVILAYNYLSAKEIKQNTNSYFIDFDLIKFIPLKDFFLKDINIFITSYFVYVYPPKSKNVYISHDIYDAPMVNKNLEKNIFLRIKKLDYIFVSSEISLNYFHAQFKKFNIKFNSKIINTGYTKLDYIEKIIRSQSSNKKKDYILLAPGYSLAFKKFNMYKNILTILEELLNQTNEKIIFRPHPLDLTNKGRKDLVAKINRKFKNNINFKSDFSPSYLNSYKNSKLLITDLSSTAYTYAFSTIKPVVFFSKNEKKLKLDNFYNLNYFKDRKNIGFIVASIDDLINLVKNKRYNSNKITSSILKLRKNRIEFFGSAVKRTVAEINKIL